MEDFIKIQRHMLIACKENATERYDTGVILCDQAKMLDVGAGNAQFKEECPEDLWNEARELIISFM